MYKARRHVPLSQNFLHNRKLVQYLVGKAHFSSTDTVLEIGPGKGIITEELAKTARTVLAVELDKQLVSYLQNKFEQTPNVCLFAADFLSFTPPSTKYKVFANTPFAIEGAVIRKLLDGNTSPDDAYLVLIKEVAERWAGIPKEGLFSILHKPWFEFKIVHVFSKKDFAPQPRVNAVLLNISKRKNPLLSVEDKSNFENFITQGFSGGRRLVQNLSRYVYNQKISIIEQKTKISFKSMPSQLTVEEWITLYTYFRYN